MVTNNTPEVIRQAVPDPGAASRILYGNMTDLLDWAGVRL
jgi:hypothetical protein